MDSQHQDHLKPAMDDSEPARPSPPALDPLLTASAAMNPPDPPPAARVYVDPHLPRFQDVEREPE